MLAAMGGEHPNAGLARRVWQAISEGDVELLAGELLAPDVVWRAHGDNPLAVEVKGPDQVLERLARLGENVDEIHMSLLQVYANDDGAVLWSRTHAERGPKVLDGDVLVHMRIADGRVARVSAVPVDQRRSDEFWRLE